MSSRSSVRLLTLLTHQRPTLWKALDRRYWLLGPLQNQTAALKMAQVQVRAYSNDLEEEVEKKNACCKKDKKCPMEGRCPGSTTPNEPTEIVCPPAPILYESPRVKSTKKKDCLKRKKARKTMSCLNEQKRLCIENCIEITKSEQSIGSCGTKGKTVDCKKLPKLDKCVFKKPSKVELCGLKCLDDCATSRVSCEDNKTCCELVKPKAPVAECCGPKKCQKPKVKCAEEKKDACGVQEKVECGPPKIAEKKSEAAIESKKIKEEVESEKGKEKVVKSEKIQEKSSGRETIIIDCSPAKKKETDRIYEKSEFDNIPRGENCEGIRRVKKCCPSKEPDKVKDCEDEPPKVCVQVKRAGCVSDAKKRSKNIYEKQDSCDTKKAFSSDTKEKNNDSSNAKKEKKKDDCDTKKEEKKDACNTKKEEKKDACDPKKEKKDVEKKKEEKKDACDPKKDKKDAEKKKEEKKDVCDPKKDKKDAEKKKEEKKDVCDPKKDKKDAEKKKEEKKDVCDPKKDKKDAEKKKEEKKDVAKKKEEKKDVCDTKKEEKKDAGKKKEEKKNVCDVKKEDKKDACDTKKEKDVCDTKKEEKKDAGGPKKEKKDVGKLNKAVKDAGDTKKEGKDVCKTNKDDKKSAGDPKKEKKDNGNTKKDEKGDGGGKKEKDVCETKKEEKKDVDKKKDECGSKKEAEVVCTAIKCPESNKNAADAKPEKSAEDCEKSDCFLPGSKRDHCPYECDEDEIVKPELFASGGFKGAQVACDEPKEVDKK